MTEKTSETVPVVDPTHPIDYSKPETPPSYRCGACGATNCKLWREYQTFLNHQTLRCADCAAKSQGKDISDIDEHGTHTLKDMGNMRSDQIGWYIPAVPIDSNDTFWGYTSVPPEGVEWWSRLPTRHQYGLNSG